MGTYTKLERLLRFHRQNVFVEDEQVADRHHRALLRLKKTRAFREMCQARKAHSDWVGSEAMLRRWA